MPREYLVPDAAVERRDWIVFDRDGRWVTTVEIPADLELMEIGEDWILALWADELGVQRIRMYGLHKT